LSSPTFRSFAAPPVRFGWFDYTHRAIDRRAIAALPASALQEYLSRPHQMRVLLDEDDLQDITANSPNFSLSDHHTLDMECLGKPAQSSQEGDRTWQTVERRFTEKNRQKWKARKVQAGQLPYPSLYHSILDNYRQITHHLSQINSGNPRLALSSNEGLVEAYYGQLPKSIGKLAHYLSDLYMPLHNTNAFTWPLRFYSDEINLNTGWPAKLPPMAKKALRRLQPWLPPQLKLKEESMHGFIEGTVFSPQGFHYAQWQQSPRPADPLPQLNSSNLPSFIIASWKESLDLIFEIVALQKRHLDHRRVIRSREAFTEEMRQLLKPQLDKAQQALTATIAGSWQEAGSPVNFPPPAT
jgi:hypothetical protein